MLNAVDISKGYGTESTIEDGVFLEKKEERKPLRRMASRRLIPLSTCGGVLSLYYRTSASIRVGYHLIFELAASHNWD